MYYYCSTYCCMISWTGKMNISMSAFVPENLVSRDGFGSPVPRQPAHSPYSGWIWCLLTGFLPSSAAASIYSFVTAIYAIGSVPSLSSHAIAYRWRSLPRVRRHGASKPQGSSERVLPCLAGHLGPINIRLSFPHPLLVLYTYEFDPGKRDFSHWKKTKNKKQKNAQRVEND